MLGSNLNIKLKLQFNFYQGYTHRDMFWLKTSGTGISYFDDEGPLKGSFRRGLGWYWRQPHGILEDIDGNAEPSQDIVYQILGTLHKLLFYCTHSRKLPYDTCYIPVYKVVTVIYILFTFQLVYKIWTA